MKIFLFLFFTLLFFKPSFSQTVQQNFNDLQVRNAIDVYNNYNANNAPVYNGEAYLFYIFKMEGDPYFETGIFSPGWVNYKGRKYESLKLIYDVVRNDLVLLSPFHQLAIVAQNQFVDSFSLLGHTFIALQEDHNQNLYNSGFYDLLYNGHIQFLERRVKTINSKIEGRIVVNQFIDKNRFYIHKGGLYYLVTNKKDVYRLFKDKIHDVKRFMRKNHLKLRHKNFESDMTKITAFYDQLTH
ncbi:MAG: hypothetical protein ABI267_01190 [Ginsengibacter sp.]